MRRVRYSIVDLITIGAIIALLIPIVSHAIFAILQALETAGN
jgi:hypothetical protein